MKYSVVKNYEKEKSNEYVVCTFKAAKNINTNSPPEIDYTFPLTYVKQCGNGRYDSIKYDNSFKNVPLCYETTPSDLKHNVNIQRSIIYIYGSSGSGKSYLMNQIASMYHNLQERKIFYISGNNASRDSSITKEIYTFISQTEFLDLFESDEAIEEWGKTGTLFDNCMIIFDDIAFKEKKLLQKFQAILNIILKFKRKNNLTCVLTSHEKNLKNGLYPSDIFVELTHYIFFGNDLLNRNSRILKVHFNLENDEIHRIKMNKDTRWTCIITKRLTVVTENEIYELK